MRKVFWLELDFCDGNWKRYTVHADGAVFVTTPILGSDRTARRWIGNVNDRRAQA